MKESLAAALRHSRREAERTYDRRTASDKCSQARAFAQEGMRRALEPDTSSKETLVEEQEHESSSSDDDHTEPRPPPGTFVALVEDRSTLRRPKIMLARVLTYPSRKVASLLWYKAITAATNTRMLFELHIDGEVWQEATRALFPVTTEPHKPTGAVRLLTTPREIHRQLQASKSSRRSSAKQTS